MLVNTGEKRGFVPKGVNWRRDVARLVVGRNARSEKREARSASNRGIKIEKLYVLNNAPEIEVGAVV